MTGRAAGASLRLTAQEGEKKIVLSVLSASTPFQVFMGPSVTRPGGGLSQWLQGADPNGCDSPPGLLSRDLEFEIIGDYTHPSPFPAKKKKKK